MFAVGVKLRVSAMAVNAERLQYEGNVFAGLTVVEAVGRRLSKAVNDAPRQR